MNEKLTRSYQVNELVRKLHGFLANEVRIVSWDQLSDLKKNLLSAAKGPMSEELKNYIGTRLHVEDFMRPIIVSEASRIIRETDVEQPDAPLTHRLHVIKNEPEDVSWGQSCMATVLIN